MPKTKQKKKAPVLPKEPLAQILEEEGFPHLTEKQLANIRRRTRARAIRQFDQREHLRAEIETRWHLDQIVSILRCVWPDSRTGQNELTQKMNGHFRILAKCLPDLKTVELQTTEALMSDDQGPQQVVIVANPQATRALRTINPMGGQELIQAADTSTDTNTDAKPETPEWLM